MDQDLIFREGEGTKWLKRNEPHLPIKNDLVLDALGELIGGLNKTSQVLEIGCSNGWRLEEIKKRYGCKVYGVDPSRTALRLAGQKGVYPILGTARDLPMADNSCDMVIYGFCLYLCNREDMFLIAKEGDRVLKDGGLMVIYDFAAPRPQRVPYKHKNGVWTYKQDYENMFLASPAYTKLLAKHHVDGQTKAVVLRKNIEQGWPSCE